MRTFTGCKNICILGKELFDLGVNYLWGSGKFSWKTGYQCPQTDILRQKPNWDNDNATNLGYAPNLIY